MQLPGRRSLALHKTKDKESSLPMKAARSYPIKPQKFIIIFCTIGFSIPALSSNASITFLTFTNHLYNNTTHSLSFHHSYSQITALLQSATYQILLSLFFHVQITYKFGEEHGTINGTR
jgi:hypothetical protein